MPDLVDLLVDQSLPAWPTSRKNQMLPVRFAIRGTAYVGLRNNPRTVKNSKATFRVIKDFEGSVIEGFEGA